MSRDSSPMMAVICPCLLLLQLLLSIVEITDHHHVICNVVVVLGVVHTCIQFVDLGADSRLIGHGTLG